MALPLTTTVDNLAIAAKLSRVYVNSTTLDQAIYKIPLRSIPMPGKSISNNVSTPGTPAWHDAQTAPTAVAAESTTVNEFAFSRLSKLIEVEQLSEVTSSNVTSQLVGQLVPAVAGIIRELSDKFINGDGTSNTLTGLRSLVTAGQTIGAQAGAANGGAATLADMNKLLHLVTSGFGGGSRALYVIAHEQTVRSLITLEEMAGSTPQFCHDPDLGGTSVYMFRGVPVYIGRLEHTETKGTSTDCTSAYACSGDISILNAGADAANWGIRVDATSGSAASIAARSYMVHGYYTVHVPTEYCLARLEGIRDTVL